MNGIAPGHPSFAGMHPQQQVAFLQAQQQQQQQQRQQAQMRLHQGAGLPPGATAGQLGQLAYQQQMVGQQGGIHPQQLQQLQQFQQQNPGIRIPPHQILQTPHMIQPQAMPGHMQHVPVQQGGQPVNGR
jgi:hypothetical protein